MNMMVFYKVVNKVYKVDIGMLLCFNKTEWTFVDQFDGAYRFKVI